MKKKFQKILVMIKAQTYLLKKTNTKTLLLGWLRHPIRMGLRLFWITKSDFSKEGYYLYGFKNWEDFKKEIYNEKTHLIIGPGYCQKPQFCPYGKFSNLCKPQKKPICQQCQIGTLFYPLKKQFPERITFYISTTAPHFLETIIELQKKNPRKNILFLITVCPYANSFLGPVCPVKGAGILLNGPVCANFSIFKSAEKGNMKGETFIPSSMEEKVKSLFDPTKSF